MTEIQKNKSIFDFLNDITYNKVSWSQQSESDKKKIQTYMLNRWLSMHLDYLELIAECQPVTDNLSTQQYYQFYFDLLPKKKFYTKYISSKSDKKYSKVIDFLSEKLQISKSEMEECIDVLLELPDGFTILKEEIKRYGFTEKELNKEFGL